MSLWEFDEAAEEIAEAHQVLERRDELRADLEPVDLEVPDALETAYESGEDIDEVADAVAAIHEATDDLTEATAAVEGGHGIFTTVGLLGANPQRHLDVARDAFADGDAFGVLAATELAIDEVDQAEGDGQIRIVGALIVLTVVGLALHAWRSQRGARAATLAAFGDQAAAVHLLTGVTPPSAGTYGTEAAPPEDPADR